MTATALGRPITPVTQTPDSAIARLKLPDDVATYASISRLDFHLLVAKVGVLKVVGLE